jgi:crotonobetainyl-CoA:carnitine CoA-transferase CaiB-like acyl-CoA transferase
MAEMPLEGLRVLELGTLVAAPFTTRLLAEFGAEVIKVEAPGGGDPLRTWRIVENGTSLWWHVQSRNKKSVTLDLRAPEGQEVVRRLVKLCDVVVENFRPGTLEKWSIGYEDLKKVNPRLIMVRISGYGQSGPYRDKVGFGSVAEAMGGIRYLTGYPDRPPTRMGISLGDSLAAMYGALGALMAVYHRDVKGTGEGQCIDVALSEAVFGMMESALPEYDRTGFVRERTGSTLPGITPSNTYPCADGKYVVIGGNNDSIFRRLMRACGRPDLAEDDRFATNAGRSEHAAFLDEVIASWTTTLPMEDVVRILDEAGVPAGPIYSIADIARDPQFLFRGMIEEAEVPGLGMLKIPGIVPKMEKTPGRTKWTGPALGAHNEEIFKGLLGMREEEYRVLQEKGVIA